MYRLLGTDRKEYGPMTADEVRRCIAERRANRFTQVRAEGETGWKPLAEFPEFSDTLASPSPPPLPGIPSLKSTLRPRTSGLAIASMVLGILGFCGITGLAGLICGLLAMVQIRRSRGSVKGTGLAIAGVIVSIIMLAGLVLSAILIPLAIRDAQQRGQIFIPGPVFSQQQDRGSRTERCEENAVLLVKGALRYAASHNGRLPNASNWTDTVQVYLPSLGTLKCPADGSNTRCSYCFNAALSELLTNQVATNAVIIFESRSGWNLSGGVNQLRPRHGGKAVVGFADGTTSQVRPEQAATLRWEP
jgi:prepilin-type processing-associated H-X9-DG protein